MLKASWASLHDFEPSVHAQSTHPAWDVGSSVCAPDESGYKSRLQIQQSAHQRNMQKALAGGQEQGALFPVTLALVQAQCTEDLRVSVPCALKPFPRCQQDPAPSHVPS